MSRKQANIKYNLKKRYGITVDQYIDMLMSQGGVCKICKRECKTYANLAVDHCHTTKKVRGLLCNKCNRGIGLLEDNETLLKNAIKYLRESSKK